MSVVVERVPVVFGRMSGISTPFQIASGNVALHDILDHSSREQSVELALEECQVDDVERSLRDERVVEDGLLVCLAPAMSPLIVHSIHLHPVTLITGSAAASTRRGVVPLRHSRHAPQDSMATLVLVYRTKFRA